MCSEAAKMYITLSACQILNDKPRITQFFILNMPHLPRRRPAFCSTSVIVQPKQWILADATDFMDQALKPYFSAMAFA